jgi:hypothetical protein
MSTRVRVLVSLSGTVEGIVNGVVRGAVIEIDDRNVERYCAQGLVERRLTGELSAPYHPS